MDRQTEELYKSLWTAYREEIYRFCRSRLYRAPIIAEDCVQQVFLALFEALEAGLVIERPRAWLYKTARHVSCRLNDHIVREVKHRTEEERAYGEGPSITFDECRDAVSGQKGEEELLTKVLTNLTEEEKYLLRAFYIEEKRCRDIGESLGLRENTVHQRLARLRLKVRRLIHDAMEEPDID